MRILAFFTLLVLVMLFQPTASLADITTGLIAHWPFDGDAQDASGNGNHGAPNVNMVLCPDRFGNPDSAYDFNGTNSWIHVPNSASLASPSTQVTMTAWINNEGWSLVGQTYNPILVKATSTTNAFMYRIIVTQGGLSAAVNSWNTGYGSSYIFDFDQWYFVASVYDAGTVSNYLNGALLDSGPAGASAMTQDTRDMYIGACTPGILEVFNGKLDDIRIYDRALTPEDIAELYGPTATRPVGLAAALAQNLPNPFQSHTTIGYTLPRDDAVTLRVYDVAGRLVRSFDRIPTLEGHHLVSWDGRDRFGRPVPAGVYFYSLRGTATSTPARKMVVQR